MRIGTFTANTKSEVKILCKTQVIQLKVSGLTANNIIGLSNSVFRVWNDRGTIIPPMSLADLLVLNGDEYPAQVSLQSGSSSSTMTLIIDIELSDEGFLNPVIYAEMTNAFSQLGIEVSAEAPQLNTAVKVRKYNTMVVMSPKLLPKQSLCIIPLQYLSSLQVDNDVMSDSEILTHSNRVLADGCMREVHPVLWDCNKSTPVIIENCCYTEIMKSFAMGYGSLSTGKIVIFTGNHEFMLYPNGSCPIQYCTKQKTIIAQQIETALAVAGQSGNVDNNEFAAAVAAVGKEAERQGLTTDMTQLFANRVVNCLPSVVISKGFNIKDFNLASESVKLAGNQKIVGR